MLKRKYMITVVLGFCLAATLFVGVTISQNGALESTTPKKGYISVPAAAFVPTRDTTQYQNIGTDLFDFEETPGDWGEYYAGVQLPHGVTVTNMTFYYWDDAAVLSVGCGLYRVNETTNLCMTYAFSTGPPGYGSVHNDVIDYATVDNSLYGYYLRVRIRAPGYYDLSFRYVVIEYEYPAPPITPETRYQDASIWVDQYMLPGERINLWDQSTFFVREMDITHVWHGFITDKPWSEMNEDEKTMFLSTNEFHLYVNDEEVQLTHITRHDSVDDYVWSLYYRVFPPGYFQSFRNHHLRGEWYWLDYTSGEWVTVVHNGTLRVRP